MCDSIKCAYAISTLWESLWHAHRPDGLVKELPTMQRFGIPRHTLSMIACIPGNSGQGIMHCENALHPNTILTEHKCGAGRIACECQMLWRGLMNDTVIFALTRLSAYRIESAILCNSTHRSTAYLWRQEINMKWEFPYFCARFNCCNLNFMQLTQNSTLDQQQTDKHRCI